MADLNQYECIDPQVGGDLWRLDDPSTEPATAERLRLHCQFCAACRLILALDTEIKTGVRTGRVSIPHSTPHRPTGFLWLSGLGAAAMAAGLTTIAVLPPSASHTMMPTRAPIPTSTIERPVSNEVVPGDRPLVTWTPLPGARAYEVSIRSVEGDYSWQGQTEETKLKLSREAALPAHQRYRLAVTPIPAHLAPEGGLRSTFTTGTRFQAAMYRLTHGSRMALATGIAGCLALVTGLIGLVWVRQR